MHDRAAEHDGSVIMNFTSVTVCSGASVIQPVLHSKTLFIGDLYVFDGHGYSGREFGEAY